MSNALGPGLNLKIGVLISVTIVAMALIAFVYTPYDPEALNVSNRLQPPSSKHFFGTDHLGRDVFSMIMVGAQTSIMVAFLAIGIGLGFGVSLGLFAAARRGYTENIVMRGNDIIFAFPAIILAILITSIVGPGSINSVIAIGVFNIPVFAQLTRGAARVLWQQEFVLAARAVGKTQLKISIEHVLPNILHLLIVHAMVQFSLAIAAEAALSYIGLGTQPPQPSWGRMLQESQTLIGLAPWLALYPGLTIMVSVLGLNLLGDGLRDWLDPRNGRKTVSV